MTQKIVGTIACLFVFALGGYCQFAHRFGDISEAEIAMEKCSFDPDASAVVLIEEGFSDNSDYELVTVIHHRLKILKQNGLKAADIGIMFQSGEKFESIDKVEAMTINYDASGKRTEFPIDKKSIYIRKVNNSFSEVKFAFPQVWVGSILEYSFRSTKEHFGGLRSWNFQSRLPVCFSSYELRPPPTLEFSYQVQNNPKYPVVVKPFEITHSIYFEMSNLPGLGDEPFMDARADYLQRVSFTVTKYANYGHAKTFMNDWNEVAKELSDDKDFGGQLKVKLKDARSIVHAVVGDKSDEQKMNYIFKFVGSQIKWDGNNSKYAIDGLKSTWSKKTGNSGCINLMLVNLLREEGLDAYPMLVSERGNGKINTTLPFIRQFNSVYAAVAVNGKMHYLDATDRYASTRLVPPEILNTTALMIRRDKGELVDITENDVKFREITYINADLSNDGALSSSVISNSGNYARKINLRNYLESKDKEKYIDEYFKNGSLNISFDSLEISGQDNDSADFVRKFKFDTHIQHTGDYAFLDLNMFTGFPKNPFIENVRFSNINFGFTSLINVNWLIKVPPAWKVDGIPKSIKIINADKSVLFNRAIVYNKENNEISARLRIELNKSLYTPDEYPDLREFCKKMATMLNEQIVFKTN